MLALTIGTAATMISPAGNRDFLNIYNNDSATIYVCYDGGDVKSSPPVPIIYTTGFGFSSGNFVSALNLMNTTGLTVGMVVAATGIPSDQVIITSVSTNSVTVTPFQANADSIAGGTVTFGGRALTTSNGWPIPAGGQLYISNDGNRNTWRHAVYGISAAGTAAGAVITQG